MVVKEDIWTNEEVQIMKDYYPTASHAKLAELLPRRSKSAIIAKASKLKIVRLVNVWTEEECKLLKRHYPSRTDNHELMKLIPNHSFVAIKTKAKLLGLRRGPYLPDSKKSTVRRWTKDEVDVLKLYYNTIEDKDLLRLLPDRTLMAIKHLSRKFGLGAKETGFHPGEHWTAAEDNFLIDNFSVLPNEELLEFLDGRTLFAIKARAQKFGLKRDKHTWASIGPYRPWTPGEIDILAKNWGKYSLAGLSELIPTRKKLGILKQAKKMKLSPYDKVRFGK